MTRRKAFTLVELLVVISIIAMLMAILAPALSGARKQGNRIVCLNNLRQMAIASQVYTNNNDGFYPSAYFIKSTDSEEIIYAWDFITIENWDTLELKVIPGLLWEGETIERIQQCPSFKGYHNWIADPYTGYNYNTSYIGHGQDEICKQPVMTNAIKKPWRCALFGDGQWKDGANKFMRSPWTNECDAIEFRHAGTQGYRHNGYTNVAWCDGHVSSQKERYTETVKKARIRIEKYNQTTSDCKIGFLSPDNSAYALK